MYVARWHLTARFGQKDACIGLLRKWEMDVGQRIGWRPGSTRLVTGALGSGDSEIEFEVQIDELDDLESAWRGMEQIPYHRAYAKELEPLVVSGSTRWSVHRIVDVSAEQT